MIGAAVQLTHAHSPWVGITEADMATIAEMRNMTNDVNGNRIDLGAVVEAVQVIPSSASSGDVPQGTRLLVDQKSGAAFIVIDADGEKHIAPCSSLRIIAAGDPERPAITTFTETILGMAVPGLSEYQHKGNVHSVSIQREERLARARQRQAARAAGRTKRAH